MAILDGQERPVRRTTQRSTAASAIPATGCGRCSPTARRTGSFLDAEPAEDLGLVRGTAPPLRSVVQTEVWGAPALWFLGPARLLRQSRLPDVLSVSYGYCERDVMSVPVERVGARLSTRCSYDSGWPVSASLDRQVTRGGPVPACRFAGRPGRRIHRI